MSNQIKVSTKVKSDINKVWEYWTTPKHIKQWNTASDDWHTVNVENNLEENGKFVYRMEAKDGSVGFDFGGTYDLVQPKNKITYKLDDGREAIIDFKDEGEHIEVIESFDPEDQHPKEMQKEGWQAILNNFKKYVEGN